LLGSRRRDSINPGKAVLWKPAAFSPGNNGWGTVARLKPGISWAQARAAFAVE